jgi:hypothetical protein
MTTAQNTFVRSEFDRFQIAVQPTTPPTINQGDMLWLTGVGNFCTPATGALAAANFLGVAEDSSPVISIGGNLTELTVRRRGTFRMNTTAAQTYTSFQSVYFGADAQTITNVATGNTLVGYVAPEQAGLAAGTQFPWSGATIDIIIKPNYPDAAV